MEDLTSPKAADINKHFEELDIEDILNAVKCKVLNLENEFNQNEVTQTQSAFIGIEDIIEGARENVDIGVPVQGEILNEVISGARRGTLIIRSGSSGVSKTRQAVGDACLIAYPFRYDHYQKEYGKPWSAPLPVHLHHHNQYKRSFPQSQAHRPQDKMYCVL